MLVQMYLLVGVASGKNKRLKVKGHVEREATS